jgi:hypothetical protein
MPRLKHSWHKKWLFFVWLNCIFVQVKFAERDVRANMDGLNKYLNFYGAAGVNARRDAESPPLFQPEDR